MPTEKTLPIIDLTEIVHESHTKSGHAPEEDELREQVSDLMRDNPTDDIELDDLLAQLNDGADEEPAASRPVVNPNESLDMPGMDDMDAMMDQFGAPSTATRNPKDADPELDDLLADLETPTPAKAARAVTVTDAEVDGPDSADKELDDLLADLDEPAPKPATSEDDDLDDDLDALLTEDDELDEPASKSAMPESLSLDDDLDALLAEDDSPVDATPAPKATAAPATDDLNLDDLLADLDAPAPKPQKGPIKDKELDDLLADLDEAVPGSASSAGEDLSGEAPQPAVTENDASPDDLDSALERAETDEWTAESEEEPSSEDLDTDDLDAFLDDEPEPVAPFSGTPAPDSAANAALLEQLREQLNAMAFSLQTSLEQQQNLREQVQALKSSETEPAPDVFGELENRLADFAGDLSSLGERLAELEKRLNPETLAATIMENMRPDIEKAAASAAASIIREEVLALFADQEK